MTSRPGGQPVCQTRVLTRFFYIRPSTASRWPGAFRPGARQCRPCRLGGRWAPASPPLRWASISGSLVISLISGRNRKARPEGFTSTKCSEMGLAPGTPWLGPTRIITPPVYFRFRVSLLGLAGPRARVLVWKKPYSQPSPPPGALVFNIGFGVRNRHLQLHAC